MTDPDPTLDLRHWPWLDAHRRKVAAGLLADCRRLRRAKDTALLTLAAATQLYELGDYAAAHRLARRVQVRFVPPRWRGVHAAFLPELRARATGRPWRRETVELSFEVLT